MSHQDAIGTLALCRTPSHLSTKQRGATPVLPSLARAHSRCCVEKGEHGARQPTAKRTLPNALTEDVTTTGNPHRGSPGLVGVCLVRDWD